MTGPAPWSWAWATGIEDTFIAQVEPGKRRLDEYELQQHYDRWREDVDLAADTGFRMIRYGIPWYRVEPERGRFDWSFTDGVLPYLAERGLEPIVDLVHYGCPLWLDGQFANPTYASLVAAYADAFATRYRDLVRCYTPFNEPFIAAELCGRIGTWPPGLRGDGGFTVVLNAICRGIVLTTEVLTAVCDDPVIVHVEATGAGLTDDESLRPRLELDLWRELAMLELVQGRVDEGHPLFAYLIANGITDGDLEWYRNHQIGLDVLGLNYYPFMSVWRRVRGDGEGFRQHAVWGGGEYLASIVRDYHGRYGCPVFITECSENERAVPGSPFGAAPYQADGKSALREAWLAEAVATCAALRSEGVPLIGFTWWPLYDLVNWEYRDHGGPAETYLERMGLHALSPDGQGGLRRVRLPVADMMAGIIREYPDGP